MEETLYNIRHSLAHLLAIAALEHDSKAKLSVGPVTENGFYYDIDFSEGKAPTPEDLKAFEKTMRKMINKKLLFARQEVSPEEARQHFAGNPYKMAIIDDIEQAGTPVSLYATGDFIDLCEGRHVDNTSEIDAKCFTLTHLAGAYWRGDEKNPMLTRVYGLAFATAEELKAYLTQQEEAKKRDHRRIAKEQDLLVFSDLVGSGMPMFTPKGNIIRNAIIGFSRELNNTLGFEEVHTPNINKAELFRISGHYDKYKEDMLVVRSQYSEEDFFLKPMNCPQHTQIYAARPRSYRDLPIRYSDFANLYRDERPGELSGLTRLRSFAQDDGHVFCMESQIEGEMTSILTAIETALTTYKIDYWMRLSLRDPEKKEKYLGDDDVWERSQAIMRKLLQEKNITHKEAEGEAAFYGPKIDIMAVDALGREWQISTVQLDFNQPKRFGLVYTDSDGTEKTPVMIHRALIGSPDRFMGILIEHYAGAFPVWLAPIQAVVLPIGENHQAFAKEITDALKEKNIRVELDLDNESLGKRVRNAKIQKIPYLLIIGDKEVAAKNITLEHRSAGSLGTQTLAECIDIFAQAITSKS
ncbi:MAG: threonine--tRNA ligase [Candidatus Moraniibacteriota bacterium]